MGVGAFNWNTLFLNIVLFASQPSGPAEVEAAPRQTTHHPGQTNQRQWRRYRQGQSLGLFTKERNHVPRAISDCDSDPFLIWKPDFTLCQCKSLSNQAFELREKILRTCERKTLSECDLCVHILEMHAEAMHRSICAVGTKYYLAVRRSCSWLGRQLQCLLTHIIQIMNPIRKPIVIWKGFRNVNFCTQEILWWRTKRSWGNIRHNSACSINCFEIHQSDMVYDGFSVELICWKSVDFNVG